MGLYREKYFVFWVHYFFTTNSGGVPTYDMAKKELQRVKSIKWVEGNYGISAINYIETKSIL